jgi:hypothetical protein
MFVKNAFFDTSAIRHGKRAVSGSEAVDAALDEALAATFPASDPVAIHTDTVGPQLPPVPRRTGMPD